MNAANPQLVEDLLVRAKDGNWDLRKGGFFAFSSLIQTTALIGAVKSCDHVGSYSLYIIRIGEDFRDNYDGRYVVPNLPPHTELVAVRDFESGEQIVEYRHSMEKIDRCENPLSASFYRESRNGAARYRLTDFVSPLMADQFFNRRKAALAGYTLSLQSFDIRDESGYSNEKVYEPKKKRKGKPKKLMEPINDNLEVLVLDQKKADEFRPSQRMARVFNCPILLTRDMSTICKEVLQ